MTEPATPPPSILPHDAKWLSPIPLKVIEALAKLPNGAWLCSDKIAAAICEAGGDRFAGRLADMAERGLLECSPGKGFRLPRRQG